MYHTQNRFKLCTKDKIKLHLSSLLANQLNRTKILLEERFGKFKNLRLISLAVFALVFPLLAIVFTASGLLSIASWILGVSILGATASELIGRYLFFVTVVPLGLAGNFFAGNQR